MRGPWRVGFAGLILLSIAVTVGVLLERGRRERAYIANSLPIASFEKDEDWTPGQPEERPHKEGRLARRVYLRTEADAPPSAQEVHLQRLVTLDLAQGFRDEDLIVLWVHAAAPQHLNHAYFCFVSDATASSGEFCAGFGDQIFETGWTEVAVRRGKFAAHGNPDWSTIRSVRIVMASRPGTEMELVYDDWHLVSAEAHAALGQLLLVEGLPSRLRKLAQMILDQRAGWGPTAVGLVLAIGGVQGLLWASGRFRRRGAWSMVPGGWPWLLPAIPLLLFLSVAIAVTWPLLTAPGMIGFTWDWGLGMQPFAPQVFDRIRSYQYAWNDKLGLGWPEYTDHARFYYWLFLAPLAIFGGAVLSKGAVVTLLLLAGTSMYWFLRTFGVGSWGATLGGLFYMLSPVVHSRLVAGHLWLVLGFALLPLGAGLFLRGMRESGFPYPLSLGAGIVLGWALVHLQIVGPAVFIIGVLVLFHVRERPFGAIRSLLLVGGVVVLLHAFWLVPSLAASLEGTAPLRRGWTAAQAVDSYRGHLEGASQGFWDSLRVRAGLGMDTEYVYPPPPGWEQAWEVASVMLPLLVLIALLRRPDRRRYLFATLALMGGLMGAGLRTPAGAWVYELLLAHLTPLYFEYARPTRWYLLSTFAYAGLLGAAASELATAWTRTSSVPPGPPAESSLRRWAAAAPPAALAVLAVVYTSAFWYGRLTQPLMSGLQPLSLQSKVISPEDRVVYDSLHDDRDDYRVAFLPPSDLIAVPQTDLHYKWMDDRVPRPEFGGFLVGQRNLAAFLAATLFQKETPSAHLGGIYGLANVRYVVRPHYSEYYMNSPFGDLPAVGGDHYDPQGRLERTLAAQEDLAPIEAPGGVKSVSFYENRSFLPHAFAPARVLLASGDLALLMSLSALPGSPLRERGILYADQIKPEAFADLAPALGGYLVYNNDWLSLLLPLLPARGVIAPGDYARGRFRGWTKLFGHHLANWHYAATLDTSRAALALPWDPSGAAALSLPYRAAQPGEFQIYLLLYHGPDAAPVNVAVDGMDVASLRPETERKLGFIWQRVGPLPLESGEHVITLLAQVSSPEQKIAVRAVVVAQPEEVAQAQRALEAALADRPATLLVEPEVVGEGERLAGPGGVPSVRVPARVPIYAPRPGNFDLAIRVAATGPAVLRVEAGSASAELPVDGEAFHWRTWPGVSLHEGINDLAFHSLGAPIAIDLLLAEERGKVPAGRPPETKVTKVNPTYYRIEAAETGPLFLFFSEAFDEAWQLDGAALGGRPVPGYGFGNLFFVPEARTELRLVYGPQRLAATGQVVTGAAWLLLLSLLVGAWARRRRAGQNG